jgi:hypothetical protein
LLCTCYYGSPPMYCYYGSPPMYCYYGSPPMYCCALVLTGLVSCIVITGLVSCIVLTGLVQCIVYCGSRLMYLLVVLPRSFVWVTSLCFCKHVCFRLRPRAFACCIKTLYYIFLRLSPIIYTTWHDPTSEIYTVSNISPSTLCVHLNSMPCPREVGWDCSITTSTLRQVVSPGTPSWTDGQRRLVSKDYVTLATAIFLAPLWPIFLKQLLTGYRLGWWCYR